MSLTVDTSVAPAAPGEFNLLHEQELGSGGYGKVVQAIQTSTGQVVAAKLIPINRMKQHAVEKEIRLMEKLRECPYTIGLRGIQQDASYYYIYMEMAELGELFTRVITAGSLQEHEAQPYMQQLMSAVQHMHALGVVHRDLKLENVLLDRNNVCKVCDFGLAHQYELKEGGKVQVTVLREVCGSKSYCAPEVLEGRGYEGFPTDVWSCGIVSATACPPPPLASFSSPCALFPTPLSRARPSWRPSQRRRPSSRAPLMATVTTATTPFTRALSPTRDSTLLRACMRVRSASLRCSRASFLSTRLLAAIGASGVCVRRRPRASRRVTRSMAFTSGRATFQRRRAS